MRDASLIAADLNCNGCGRPLVIDGYLKCLRCKHLVEATLGQKRIFCPQCRKPRILLARHNQALCQDRRCSNYQQKIGTPMVPREQKEKKEEKMGNVEFYKQTELLFNRQVGEYNFLQGCTIKGEILPLKEKDMIYFYDYEARAEGSQLFRLYQVASVIDKGEIEIGPINKDIAKDRGETEIQDRKQDKKITIIRIIHLQRMDD